jgi:tRNA pseudouridine13 synthase
MLSAEQPMITSTPGTGGMIRSSPEDFEVTEIPAYDPTGEGDHVMAWIEKRELSTFDAVRALSRALGVNPADIGTAGMKDRTAITRQQISLPPPVTPEAVSAVDIDGLTVLSAARHPHKLRTGHLRGNAFKLRIRELDVPVDEAAGRAWAILAELARPPGSPNWFGDQRFGRGGDNAAIGRAILAGELTGKRKPRGKKLRLMLSAVQSELFNRTLAARITGGSYRQIVEGDVLKRTDSGGVFVCEDPAVDGPRLERGEVVQTGPMFGPKMHRPAPDSPAAQLEQRILESSGLEAEAFARYARLMPGTRRPIAIAIDGVSVNATDGEILEVGFTLPSGAYATAVLREITKALKYLDTGVMTS